MLTREDIESLLNRGGSVIGSDGDRIGAIGQLYADDDTGEPTWVTVNTGLFGSSQSFVPVEGARIDGDDLVVPYTPDHVKDAPRVEADGHLEPEEEDRLYAHYDRGTRTYSDARTGTDLSDADFRGDADLNAGAGTGAGMGTGMGTGAGRDRLRKYVTSGNATRTDPGERGDGGTVNAEVRKEHTETDGIDETRR